MPKVSIIVAAFNARSFIGEAIESVIRQTHQDWELIIGDDASSDDTADVAAQYQARDSRIKYCRLEQNGGAGRARAEALALATGDWVTVLDSDDTYLPTRLATLLEICEANDLDAVCDNQLFLDHNTGKIIGQGLTLPAPRVRLTLSLFLRNDSPPFRFPFGIFKPFVRRQFLLDHAIAYPETRVGEDFLFTYSLLYHGARAELVGTPYYVYTLPSAPGSRTRSPKSRTIYGTVPLETNYQHTKDLLLQLGAAKSKDMQAVRLLEIRAQQILCGIAFLTVIHALRQRQFGDALRPLLQTHGWPRFVLDKARNIIEKSHIVRGLGPASWPGVQALGLFRRREV